MIVRVRTRMACVWQQPVSVCVCVCVCVCAWLEERPCSSGTDHSTRRAATSAREGAWRATLGFLVAIADRQGIRITLGSGSQAASKDQREEGGAANSARLGQPRAAAGSQQVSRATLNTWRSSGWKGGSPDHSPTASASSCFSRRALRSSSLKMRPTL